MARRIVKPKAKSKKRRKQTPDDGLIGQIKRDGDLVVARDPTNRMKVSLGAPEKFLNFKFKF